MNDSIRLLADIADKETKYIIGLMSGTSLDGLDIALCKISGLGAQTKIELTEFKTVAYPKGVAERLKPIVSVEEVSLQKVCMLNSWLGNYHADLILDALQHWKIEPAEVDCIASHGQTIYHAPITHHRENGMPNATLQIGDGDHIARKTGILTLSDFRQKHTAAGGEGAPMVAVTDAILYADAKQSRLLLNIGGIANFTYVPASEQEMETITTDIGPGNTLIDQSMQALFDKPFDEGGKVAASGSVQPELLKVLLDDPFFDLPMPRTTGPERFNMTWVRQRMKEAEINNIANPDMVATLTWLSAQSIADAIQELANGDQPEVYLSGGGMHNPQLVAWIEELLQRPTHSFEEIGFNPDAKEAVCFAILANEALSGEAFTIKPKQNAGRRVNFGKISLPV